MLSLNNVCLASAQVTFYQISRSLTLPFNIFLTLVILKQQTPHKAALASLLIVLGVVIGSVGERKFSLTALITGILSSAFVCLYNIYSKKFLSVVSYNEWVLLHYNTSIAVLLGTPLLFLTGELNKIAYRWFLGEFNFWLIMLLTGLWGLLINVSTFLQSKVASHFTCALSGITKMAVQYFLASVLFKEHVSPLSWVGLFLILIGSCLYYHMRTLELKVEE
ncbi:hypothetical protein DSO57_1018261 [Entomophthora muscae]|uniref:Uncharacterized protein n=1 Tax=Entomophthora muscae TaxID=34485 RepID=A0ACC2U2V8_9FUNG|nr:hypothetical protein DSO57_1018261 [Entomophthora muscae]